MGKPGYRARQKGFHRFLLVPAICAFVGITCAQGLTTGSAVFRDFKTKAIGAGRDDISPVAIEFGVADTTGIAASQSYIRVDGKKLATENYVHAVATGNVTTDTVYTVGIGQEFSTIQGALNYVRAMTPVNGTTNAVVLVHPGTYDERVTVETTGVTVRGLARDACVIETSAGVSSIWGTSAPLWIRADRVRVEGLTVRNIAHFGGVGGFVAAVGIKVNDTRTTFTRFDALNCRFEGDSGAVLVTGPWSTAETTHVAHFSGCEIYGGKVQAKNALCVYRGYNTSTTQHLGGSRAVWLGGRVVTERSGTASDSAIVAVDQACRLDISGTRFLAAGQQTLFAPVVDATVYASDIDCLGSLIYPAYSVYGTSPNVRLSGVKFQDTPDYSLGGLVKPLH
ncbi:MAG: hypothetical protein N2111_14200, partial [Candidatus Sumerlaeaceae bacterium]|nr:hypothetical protein [Candidatus Sumerlaeaceae bacterium]